MVPGVWPPVVGRAGSPRSEGAPHPPGSTQQAAWEQPSPPGQPDGAPARASCGACVRHAWLLKVLGAAAGLGPPGPRRGGAGKGRSQA